MSASLSGNPLMSGGGVDASIPLKAGAGIPAPVNPLAQVGDFARTLGAINSTKLQGQQLQAGQMSLAQQLRQLAYSHLAPGVADGTIHDESSLTTALGTLEHNYGIPTDGVLRDIVSQTGQGGNFADRLKALTVAGAQAPENAVKAVAPTVSNVDVGGQIITRTTPNAGMPNQGVPTDVAGTTKGYTPGEQLGGIHRPATQADVDAGRATAIGQDIIVPATNLPASGGYNPGVGGARVPVPPGALGPGGYRPPQRPLTQLGAPYQPPGTAAPGAAAPGTGARLMKGPGGSFMVPPDKVAIFQQNGYQ